MNISGTLIKQRIIGFLHRFHVVIFVITVLGGLAVMMFFLNNTLVLSTTDDGYTSTSNDASFDQATIERIKQLKQDGSESQLDLSGRSNPFVE